MSAILSIVGVPFVKAYAYLGWTGLLSIPLWVAAFAMLLKYRRDDRRNVRYLVALVLGLAAMSLADFAATSASKIVIDRTEEIEAARAQQRHSRLNEYGEADMAGQMHFVEDSAPETPSVAPASDSAESAIGSALDDMNPEHRFGEKKKRASGRTEKVGNAAEIYEEKAKEEKPPRTMKEPDVILAGRVNWLNLRIARIAFFLALALLVWDYLVRFNRWMPGYPALPLSAPWIDSISKKDFECTARDDRKDRFLSDLVHRGETFIVAADGARLLDSVDSVARLDIPLGRGESAKHLRMFGFPVLSVEEGDPRGWEFIFDAAWFNRYAVVYNGSTSALLAALESYLGDRHATRAFARRTVNLVLSVGAIGGDDARRAFMRLLRPANWRLCEFVPAPKETPPATAEGTGTPEPTAAAAPAKPAKKLTPEEEAARKAKNAAIAAKFAKMAGGKGATTAGGVAAPEPPAAAAPVKPAVKAGAAAPAQSAPEPPAAAAPVASEPTAPSKSAEPVPEKPTEAPKAAPAKPAAKPAPAPQPAAKPAPAKPAPAPIAKPADDVAKAARLARLQAKFGGKGGATTVGGAAAPEPPAATAPVKPAVKAETPAPAAAKPAATPAPQPAAKPAVAPAPKADPAPIAKPADDAAKAARLARLQAKFGKGGAPASAESHPAPAVAPVKAEAPAKPAPQSDPAAAAKPAVAPAPKAEPAPIAKPADDVAKAARLARLQAKFGGKGGATAVGGAAAPEPPAATAPVKPAVRAEATAPAKSAAAPEPPAATAPVKPAVRAEATAPAKSAPVAPESPVAAAPAPAKPAPAPAPAAPAPEKPAEAPKPAPAATDRKPAPKFIIKHGATAQAANPEPQLSPEEKLRAMRAEHLKVKFGKPKTVQPVEPAVKNEVVEQPVPQPHDIPVAPVAKAENTAPQPQGAEPHAKLEFGKISISLDDLDLPPSAAPSAAADDDVVVVAYSRELQGKSYADVSAGVNSPAAPAAPAKKAMAPASRPAAPGPSGKHGIRIIRKK